MPEAAIASKTASWWFTVPMSRMVVVPARSISARPSRALASRERSSCAASSGQMRSFSQASSGRSSAIPRKSAWQRCTCVCTKPGITAQPRASITRAPGGACTRPIRTISRPRTCTSPTITRRAGSIVTTVPPRTTRSGDDVSTPVVAPAWLLTPDPASPARAARRRRHAGAARRRSSRARCSHRARANAPGTTARTPRAPAGTRRTARPRRGRS